MSDEQAIHALLEAYAARMDTGDFAGVGALFARATLRTAPVTSSLPCTTNPNGRPIVASRHG